MKVDVLDLIHVAEATTVVGAHDKEVPLPGSVLGLLPHSILALLPCRLWVDAGFQVLVEWRHVDHGPATTNTDQSMS